MLAVTNLVKNYNKGKAAVDNISFSIDNGEIAVLLGPNGAGKSTTIKCITGLLRYEGSIEINGHPNKSLDAKRMIGYVPETPALYEMLTVYEHLEFIAHAYSLSAYHQYANELLERFDLTDKKEKLGKELSKGMQQKVSICCALLIRPKVVMFDEPMVGLDPKAIKELKSIFQELKAQGASLLISTHLIDSIIDTWDQALIMLDGRVITRPSRSDLEAGGESLEELFFKVTEGQA